MRDNMKVGDEVTTIGGIVGKIVSLKDETVVIETTKDKTHIRFLRAAIRSVERAASMQTKLYTVVLTVPADVGGLMSGMFADVTFRTDTAENTIVVPTEAILTSNHVQYVFVVEDGAAKYVEVTTGLTGSGVTEVTSGLTEVEQLVTVGQAYLSDGDPVRVVSGEE